MRTIRLEKTDKGMLPPNGNPISLQSMEDVNLGFGDIRYVKTGIRFYFPRDIQKMIESTIPGLFVLGVAQQEPDGCLQVVVCCCAVTIRIGRSQKIANMTLFEMSPLAIRFAEFDAGTRVIRGAPETIEDGGSILDSESRA